MPVKATGGQPRMGYAATGSLKALATAEAGLTKRSSEAKPPGAGDSSRRRYGPSARTVPVANGGSEHEPAKQHTNVPARLRERPSRFDETAPILACR